MVRIGVTGLMGSGKSTVARRFQERGAALIDADALGWEVLRRPEVEGGIAAAFGPAVIGPGGAVDRGALGRVVFREPPSLERLNAIVQPALRRRVREALEGTGRPEAVLVLDAALLTSWKLEPELDGVVEVVAPPGVRVARLRAARGFAEEEAWERVRGQPLPPPRGARRLWRIENTGAPDALTAQADRVWVEIAALAEESPRG